MSKNSGILRQCPRIPEFRDNVQKFREFKNKTMYNIPEEEGEQEQ